MSLRYIDEFAVKKTQLKWSKTRKNRLLAIIRDMAERSYVLTVLNEMSHLSLLIILNRFLDFITRVHHKRALTDDGFAEWFTG